MRSTLGVECERVPSFWISSRIRDVFRGLCAHQRCSTCPDEHDMCCTCLVCIRMPVINWEAVSCWLLFLVLLCWRAIRLLFPPNRSWFDPSPRPNPIRQTRHWGTLFGGWGCALCRAGVSPEMRASPSTCKVLIIVWHVRSLYRCLWHARGLCFCPCVTTPRGLTSLPP